MKNLEILVNGKYLSENIENVSDAYICEIYTEQESLFLKPVKSVGMNPFDELKYINILENMESICVDYSFYEYRLNESLETFNKDIYFHTSTPVAFNSLKKLSIDSIVYMKTKEYLFNLINTIDTNLLSKLENLDFTMNTKIDNGKMYIIDIIENKEILKQISSFDYDSLFKISFNLAKGIFDYLSDGAYIIDIRLNSNFESLLDNNIVYNQDLYDNRDWDCIKEYNDYKFTFQDKNEYKMNNFYYGDVFNGKFDGFKYKDEFLDKNLVNVVNKDKLDDMIDYSLEDVLNYFNPLEEVNALLENEDYKHLKDKVTFITRKWKDWYVIPLFKVADFCDSFVNIDNLNYYNNAQCFDISLVYHKKLSDADILETKDLLKNAYFEFLDCVYSNVNNQLEDIKSNKDGENE